MKRILVLLLFLSSILFPQTFESKSERVTLNIKKSPPDLIAPILKIYRPKSFSNFPSYSRDSLLTVTGKAEDNVKVSQVLVNGVKLDSVVNGKFSTTVKLTPGTNELIFQAFDKSKNKCETRLTVIQDPNADIQPPLLSITEPIINRGLIVVRDTTKIFRVQGKVTDDNLLFGMWINNEKVEPVNGEFTKEYTKKPDTLSILVVDKYGNYDTKFLQISEDIVNKDSLKIGKYYALIIGVQQYADPSINDLDFPVTDSKKFMDVLTEKYTFPKENITFLENPNRTKIIQTLSDLKKKIKNNDNLLIFYAGHGLWDEDLQQGFWLPSNANHSDPAEWLPNSTIRDYIKGIKSKHTLLIADACFSGGIFKSRDAFVNASLSIIETYKSPSRRAITSGALKAVPDKSVFVEYLIKKLEENPDKWLPAQVLFMSFKDAVVNNSPTQQTPIYGTIQEAGDEGGGDFIFIQR